jgi:hypothetical protein
MPKETKEEFIAKWCSEHNLTLEFFYENLSAWPTADFFNWRVIGKRDRDAHIRLSVKVVREIAAALNAEPISEKWKYVSGGGNVLTCKRSQTEDKYDTYDVIDFIWNEND